MTAVDFLQHENPLTSAGVELATLGADDQRQTNYATQSALAEFLEIFYQVDYEKCRIYLHLDEDVCVIPLDEQRRGSSSKAWKSQKPESKCILWYRNLLYKQTKQLPHAAKVDLVWQLGV
ncbi:hypothetical protein TNCV_5033801 [Trichonephila clavipes]|nr:hypothetical protein TNCV_5033801 [Trichonephila clavipes]